MRVLWSLPRAVPALLRHFAAYIELIGQDLSQAQEEFEQKLLASAVVAISVFFVVQMACFAVIAVTWDTPHRLAAIVWMGLVFLAAAVGAAVYKGRVSRAQSPLLATVRREWQEDRLMLDRILADED